MTRMLLLFGVESHCPKPNSTQARFLTDSSWIRGKPSDTAGNRGEFWAGPPARMKRRLLTRLPDLVGVGRVRAYRAAAGASSGDFQPTVSITVHPGPSPIA